MALSGEEIRRRLQVFCDEWRDYSGSERSEAQTFLNQLLECFGTDRKAVGAHFEELTPAGGFMDMIWPRVCIVEMKRQRRGHSSSPGGQASVADRVNAATVPGPGRRGSGELVVI